jgi:threonine dehydratase
MIPYEWLEQAAERLDPYIIKTPLDYDPVQDIYIKWENQQVTGSFKVRGAMNKVLTLQPWERQRGLVAASAGNHGQGVALAGKLSGAQVIVYASQNAIPAKIAAMRALEAEVRLITGGYGEAEAEGIAFAAASGSNWISPYNDGLVIAGQGTIGLEILEQLPSSLLAPGSPLSWCVPVGGGGLMAGIAGAIAERATTGKGSHSLVGVQSVASPFFHAIFKFGSQASVVELPSLADGLSGPVQEGSVTIPILKRNLNEFLLVDEDEIAAAIVYAWKKYAQRIEGSAAAALAAILTGKLSARPAVVIISGGNIQPEVHTDLIARYSN